MVTISSKYLGELRTEAEHLKSGEKIITDAPTDNKGKGQSFSPTDLVCASLTSCMMTIMGIYANTQGFSLEGLVAETTKIMLTSPRKIKAIQVVFKWPEPTASAEDIAKLKELAISCPVALSLSKDLEQQVEFQF